MSPAIPLYPGTRPFQRIPFQWSLHHVDKDGNWGQWSEMAIGCVPRRGVTQKQAAVHLLIDFWMEDKEENDVDQFHWINEDGFLSISELSAIAREVW